MTYSSKNFKLVKGEGLKTQMIQFLEENNIPSASKFYHWLYESNYTQNNLITHVLYSDQRAIGFGSIQYFPLENIKIGSMVNLYIEAHHRTLGPALILEKALLHDPAAVDACDYFIAKPNSLADIVFKRLKFTEFGKMRRFTLILNPVHYVQLSPWMDKFISKFVNTFFKLYYFISLQTSRLKKPGCSSRHAEFVVDVKRYLENYSDFHYWRYVESNKSEIQICRFFEKNNVDSFILFHVQDNVLSIDDIRGAENECLESLLIHFIYLVIKRYNIRNISLSVLTENAFMGILSNLGFIERKDSSAQTIYAMNGNLQGKVNRQDLLSHLIFPTNLDF